MQGRVGVSKTKIFEFFYSLRQVQEHYLLKIFPVSEELIPTDSGSSPANLKEKICFIFISVLKDMSINYLSMYFSFVIQLVVQNFLTDKHRPAEVSVANIGKIKWVNFGG
jgi:hypothetical protein